MESVQRVEIVVDSLHRVDVCRALLRAGATGYTVIPHVLGAGDRGDRSGDDLTDVFHNVYILTACPKEVAERIAAAVEPLLADRGGVCLLSDARWVAH